ncbi:MAG: Fic family protein [Pseudobdellovibrionaceae bacterium]
MGPKTDTSNLLPPFIFPGKTAKERKHIAALKGQGRIRSIGPRLYTSVPEDKLESVVRSSWAVIVAKLFPATLISHVTALTYQPTENGEIYLTASTHRDLKLPGLTIKFMRGPVPFEGDVDFMGMKASSFERALLENLAAAKRSLGGRAISKEEIQARLEEVLRHKDEEGLKKLRERAKVISQWLDMELEFKRLDRIIAALLGTKPRERLRSEQAIARAQGSPFDPKCFSRLEILFAHLRHLPLKEIKEKNKSPVHFIHKAFFETYFSNYIEGTTFEVKEAEEVIFGNRVPSARLSEAHDILSTYKIISNPNEMMRLPGSAQDLEEILKSRHRFLFEERSDILRGKFKKANNQAGSNVSVPPDYVKGTLQKGFELYQSLPGGLARAIFIQFFISDIHPFNEGNGRISRIMMNAELYAQGLTTIIIPNVYRNDYLSNLKALHRKSDTENYTRMLSIAHEFSALDFSDYNAVKSVIESKNWFREPDGAKLKDIEVKGRGLVALFQSSTRDQ